MSIRENEQVTARRRSRTSRSALAIWTIPVMLLAPLGLGAKGCGAAVVGDDCAENGKGENCAGAGGGSSSGGKTAQGGQAAKGGAPATGGAPGSGGGTSKGCGSFADAQCGADEYCAYSLEARCGIADHPGTCTPLPTSCRDIYQPVCGCDGKDYGNECEAAARSVSVAKLGKCGDPVESACGGLNGIACKDGEFCNHELDAKCGAFDLTGVCAPIPTACDSDLKPVCGCDGNTYSNACMANLNSVAVAQEGACPPKACGSSGLTCNEDEFCHQLEGELCGARDVPTVCEKIPDVCDASDGPVCACNGRTYPNLCVAYAAKVPLLRLGACASPPACGKDIDSTCAQGSYCLYAPDAACGEDADGRCAVMPTSCTKEYMPVCGCDGKTYGNTCEAARAGVSIAADGACK